MALALALLCALALSAATEEAPEWKVELRALDQAFPGKRVRMEVDLIARDGFHINDDYPLYFRATKTDTATPSKPRFDRTDGLVLEPCPSGSAHKCRARLPISVTASRTSGVEVKGTLAFSVCDPNRCLIKKVDLSMVLPAAPAPQL